MSNLNLDQIDAALKAGIISKDQAQEMRKAAKAADTVTLSTDTADRALIGNEENLRFIRGFSDIFIAIGVSLIALGIMALSAIMGGGPAYLLAAGLMFIMADYFGRKKRSHLPTLITALAFLIFAQRGLGDLLGGFGGAGPLTTAFITAVIMTLFYLRIRLPFCIALIAIALLYLFYTLIFTVIPGMSRESLGWVLVLGGLITLAAAMTYDMKDVHRTTRFSDNAFWLHLLAAPLIIHGLVIAVVTTRSETLFGFVPFVNVEIADAFIVLGLIAVISVIGLALNRRALIVSSLGYALLALGFIISNAGAGLGLTLTLSLLILGLSIVLLGIGWHPSRNQILKLLPNWPVFPPPFDPSYIP